MYKTFLHDIFACRSRAAELQNFKYAEILTKLTKQFMLRIGVLLRASPTGEASSTGKDKIWLFLLILSLQRGEPNEEAKCLFHFREASPQVLAGEPKPKM